MSWLAVKLSCIRKMTSFAESWFSGNKFIDSSCRVLDWCQIANAYFDCRRAGWCYLLVVSHKLLLALVRTEFCKAHGLLHTTVVVCVFWHSCAGCLSEKWASAFVIEKSCHPRCLVQLPVTAAHLAWRLNQGQESLSTVVSDVICSTVFWLLEHCMPACQSLVRVCFAAYSLTIYDSQRLLPDTTLWMVKGKEVCGSSYLVPCEHKR